MIEFKNATKRYGKTTALDSFSLAIEKPGIYCLLGRNGAGKTTMLKTLSGHIAVSSGEVAINGNPVGMLSMPDGVYFVESSAAQFNMKLEDLFRAAADINPSFDYQLSVEMANRFHLDRTKRFNKLSFGMKVMANTLIAMSSGKDIILLDEPVLGFDPVMRKAFYDMLQESCAQKGNTVIVSTHIIDEISKVAEYLIIIDKGRLLLFSDMNEIDEKAYSVTGPVENVAAATEGLHVIGETKAGGFLSRYVFDRRIEDGDGYSVTSLGLQDFFVSLVGDESEEM